MRFFKQMGAWREAQARTRKTGFWAVVGRECVRLSSRPLYLGVVFVIPLLSLFFFTTFLQAGLPNDLPIVVLDLDHTATSRSIVRNIRAIPTVHVYKETQSFKEALDEMKQGRAYSMVTVPQNFQADLLAQRQPEVVVYTQFGYLIGGSLLMRDLNLTLSMLSGGVNMKMQQARGEVEEVIRARVQPIRTDMHTLANPWTNYSVYLTTTMLPGILQIMIFLMTVYAIGVELKEKTSRRWLHCARGSIGKAMAGKLLPYTLMFTLILWSYNAVCHGFMHFPMQGSYVRLLLGGLLFVLAQQGLAVFVIALIPVLRDALSVAAVLGTLGLTFSGLTFPISGLLPVMQAWSQAFPIRHYYLIYVNEALRGVPFYYTWPYYVFLLIFMLLPFLVLFRLKKALVHQNYPLG